MKALSARQAVSCETSKRKRCRCRCGGLLHGKGRIADADERDQLPAGDPHAAPPEPLPDLETDRGGLFDMPTIAGMGRRRWMLPHLRALEPGRDQLALF